MKTSNLILLLCLFLIMPCKEMTVNGQNLSDGTVQVDQSSDDSKSDKKKDKDKIKIDKQFFQNLAINLVCILLIISFIYYSKNRRNETVFTLIVFNIIIFLLTFVMNKVKISMGVAFGLFAVFSMLRYRTLGISMKDMTYLFVFIAIGLINAIKLELHELAIINGIIIISLFIFDGNVIIKREYSKRLRYERIDLIKPEKKDELLADLKARTGLNIHRFTINRIDFLRDTANIRIFYRD